jgi:hypothetical protein
MLRYVSQSYDGVSKICRDNEIQVGEVSLMNTALLVWVSFHLMYNQSLLRTRTNKQAVVPFY